MPLNYQSIHFLCHPAQTPNSKTKKKQKHQNNANVLQGSISVSIYSLKNQTLGSGLHSAIWSATEYDDIFFYIFSIQAQSNSQQKH